MLKVANLTVARFICLYLLVLLISYGGPTLAQDLQGFNSWAHQRVALNNSSIHFRYAGSGPPVLLVHGVPEHSVRLSILTEVMKLY